MKKLVYGELTKGDIITNHLGTKIVIKNVRYTKKQVLIITENTPSVTWRKGLNTSIENNPIA